MQVKGICIDYTLVLGNNAGLTSSCQGKEFHNKSSLRLQHSQPETQIKGFNLTPHSKSLLIVN